MHFQAPFTKRMERPLIFTNADNHPFVTKPLAEKTLERQNILSGNIEIPTYMVNFRERIRTG
jgi:hypothetical protein